MGEEDTDGGRREHERIAELEREVRDLRDILNGIVAMGRAGLDERAP